MHKHTHSSKQMPDHISEKTAMNLNSGTIRPYCEFNIGTKWGTISTQMKWVDTLIKDLSERLLIQKQDILKSNWIIHETASERSNLCTDTQLTIICIQISHVNSCQTSCFKDIFLASFVYMAIIIRPLNQLNYLYYKVMFLYSYSQFHFFAITINHEL